MDQEANYLVWMRRRQVLMMSSTKDTWEERAFMEDARGKLGGGSMWPPRSYSCSFCRREFRSAQALGGHMNVHRRDRARLKQSLGPYNVHPSNSTPEIFTLGCDLDMTSYGSLSSSRVSAQESSPNDHHATIASPPLISSHSSSSRAQEHQKGCPNSNPEAAKSTTSPSGNHEATGTTDADHKVMNRIDMEEFVSTTTTCKRFKASASVSTLSFLVHNDRCSLQLGHNYSFSSVEEIDLELRLGDPPKVQ